MTDSLNPLGAWPGRVKPCHPNRALVTDRGLAGCLKPSVVALFISPRPVRTQNSKTRNIVLSSRLLCLNLFVSRYHLPPPAATVLPRRLSCHSRDSPTEHAIYCPAIFSLTRLLASIPRVHDGARKCLSSPVISQPPGIPPVSVPCTRLPPFTGRRLYYSGQSRYNPTEYIILYLIFLWLT